MVGHMLCQEPSLLVAQQGLELVAWASRRSWVSVLVPPHGSGLVTVHEKAVNLTEFPIVSPVKGIYDNPLGSHCEYQISNACGDIFRTYVKTIAIM